MLQRKWKVIWLFATQNEILKWSCWRKEKKDNIPFCYNNSFIRKISVLNAYKYITIGDLFCINYFVLKDRTTSIKKKGLAQLCCKESEMLFDNSQCNTRGKISPLRLMIVEM